MAEAFSIYAKYSDHQSHLGVPLITGRRSRPTPPNSYHNIHFTPFASSEVQIDREGHGLSEEKNGLGICLLPTWPWEI